MVTITCTVYRITKNVLVLAIESPTRSLSKTLPNLGDGAKLRVEVCLGDDCACANAVVRYYRTGGRERPFIVLEREDARQVRKLLLKVGDYEKLRETRLMVRIIDEKTQKYAQYLKQLLTSEK